MYKKTFSLKLISFKFVDLLCVSGIRIHMFKLFMLSQKWLSKDICECFKFTACNCAFVEIQNKSFYSIETKECIDIISIYIYKLLGFTYDPIFFQNDFAVISFLSHINLFSQIVMINIKSNCARKQLHVLNEYEIM